MFVHEIEAILELSFKDKNDALMKIWNERCNTETFSNSHIIPLEDGNMTLQRRVVRDDVIEFTVTRLTKELIKDTFTFPVELGEFLSNYHKDSYIHIRVPMFGFPQEWLEGSDLPGRLECAFNNSADNPIQYESFDLEESDGLLTITFRVQESYVFRAVDAFHTHSFLEEIKCEIAYKLFSVTEDIGRDYFNKRNKK